MTINLEPQTLLRAVGRIVRAAAGRPTLSAPHGFAVGQQELTRLLTGADWEAGLAGFTAAAGPNDRVQRLWTQLRVEAC